MDPARLATGVPTTDRDLAVEHPFAHPTSTQAPTASMFGDR